MWRSEMSARRSRMYAHAPRLGGRVWLVVLCGLWMDLGCGSGDERAGLLASPLGELPATLDAVGLYDHLLDPSRVHPAAIAYLPKYELWSNGSHKERHIVLPAGTQVDNADREAWQFPVGTLFFKTFYYPDTASPEQLDDMGALDGTESWRPQLLNPRVRETDSSKANKERIRWDV
jgi:hypothetical protein